MVFDADISRVPYFIPSPFETPIEPITCLVTKGMQGEFFSWLNTAIKTFLQDPESSLKGKTSFHHFPSYQNSEATRTHLKELFKVCKDKETPSVDSLGRIVLKCLGFPTHKEVVLDEKEQTFVPLVCNILLSHIVQFSELTKSFKKFVGNALEQLPDDIVEQKKLKTRIDFLATLQNSPSPQSASMKSTAPEPAMPEINQAALEFENIFNSFDVSAIREFINTPRPLPDRVAILSAFHDSILVNSEPLKTNEISDEIKQILMGELDALLSQQLTPQQIKACNSVGDHWDSLL